MGGGNNQPSSQTVNQTNLPEYARPYFERMMAKSEATANQPYQPYTGQRVEGLNNFQTTGMSQIANMQAPWQNNAAGQSMAGAVNGLQGLTGYQSNNIASTYNPQATQMFNAPERVQATFKPGEFDAASADKYMSPYQQKVVDIQKREATKNFAQAGVGRDMAAARAGAFGGSRAALVNQKAGSDHAQLLDDIQAKGSQSAFENAQRQFEADRQARYQASQQGLGASQFNSQQQMAYGQAGQQNQQFNEAQRMQAGQMRMQGDIANEQARQAALGLNQNTYRGIGELSNSLAGQGKTQQEMDLQRSTAMMGAGDKLQQTNQSALDTAYDNFVNQRDYGKQQLNFFNSMLRGVPVTANSDVQVKTASNPLSQIAGLGIAGLGAYNAYQGR